MWWYWGLKGCRILDMSQNALNVQCVSVKVSVLIHPPIPCHFVCMILDGHHLQKKTQIDGTYCWHIIQPLPNPNNYSLRRRFKIKVGSVHTVKIFLLQHIHTWNKIHVFTPFYNLRSFHFCNHLKIPYRTQSALLSFSPADTRLWNPLPKSH